MRKKRWNDKVEFRNRVLHFADEIGVKVRSIAFRQMTTKWASCSTNGYLNFNVDLLDMDKEIGEYVIVHELLHFNTPNHGKLWKSLMSAFLGDYEKLEKRLKKGSMVSLLVMEQIPCITQLLL